MAKNLEPRTIRGFHIERRAGAYLLVAGLIGVLSLLLVPFERIAPDTGLHPIVLRLVSIIQPAVLTIILIIVGNALAPRVGLQAPLTQASAAGDPALPVLREQFAPAAAGAVAVALILITYSLTVVPLLVEAREGEAFARLVANGPPLLTKILYGGITEELITRWGLVSLFAWAAWRLSGSPAEVPHWVFWSAIVLAAALFAAGHLPLLFALITAPPWWAISAVLLGNAVPGVVFGWLFWKYGIEAAILAHAAAHVIATLLQLL
ncbi:MAG: CPBP family glutamic-type intramembrane protease [Pseudomonadota bacterium]|nr:CPBP family glutamic-type intramembrane protease [Pseudomonadota bacterium]